jgi:hypothetical protein
VPITFDFAGTWTSLPADVQPWLPDLSLDSAFTGTLQTEETGSETSGVLTLSHVEITDGAHVFSSDNAYTFQTDDGIWHSDGSSTNISVTGALMPLPLDAFRVTWSADGTGTLLFSGLGFGVGSSGTRLIGTGTFAVTSESAPGGLRSAPEPATLLLCLLGEWDCWRDVDCSVRLVLTLIAPSCGTNSRVGASMQSETSSRPERDETPCLLPKISVNPDKCLRFLLF